jgi:hypothetical protein
VSRAFRCAANSAALDEAMSGTASTVRAFLLLEVPGPWGVDALRDCRLPDAVAGRIRTRCADAGVRPLLIRRHGRTPSGDMRCLVAHADVEAPWMESTHLTRPEEVLDLDMDRLGRGESVGLGSHDDPVFLVCTHGRHDVCCAEQGRPVAAALSRSYPDLTWECSHIGGDRFAGNMLVLPHGLYYGRLDRHSAARVVELHREGHLDLDHLRGWSGLGFACQAAEWHLRRELAATALGQLHLRSQQVRGDVTEAVFAVEDPRGSSTWRVRIRGGRGEPAPLTCSVRRLQRPLRFELVDVARTDAV